MRRIGLIALHILARVCFVLLGLLAIPVVLVLLLAALVLAPAIAIVFGLWELVKWLLGWNGEDELSEDEQSLVKSRRQQTELLPALQARLAEAATALESSVPEKPADETVRWLYERYLEWSHCHPDHVLESVKVWVQQYEELQSRHPQALRLPDPRLAAIGPYTTNTIARDYRWKSPELATLDSVSFQLVFHLEAGAFEPDEQMFALWERYRARHPLLLEEYRRLILDHYAAQAPGEAVNLAEALRQVQGGTVTISRDVNEAGEYAADVQFDVEWELEHPVGFWLDEEANIVEELQ
jgi:hypothetical protein